MSIEPPKKRSYYLEVSNGRIARFNDDHPISFIWPGRAEHVRKERAKKGQKR